MNMNIKGEYTVKYNIYTMFDVYTVKITNHNLITNEGYDFFITKWCKEGERYPIELGYYHDNKFYKEYNLAIDTYDEEMNYNYGSYSTTTCYVDKRENKQYRFVNGEFVDYYEKLSVICLGDCTYDYSTPIQPQADDKELYSPREQLDTNDKNSNSSVTPFFNKLIMKYEVPTNKVINTTEIGVKTNHGRLVSHDIHEPYNLPLNTNITLEYVFQLN